MHAKLEREVMLVGQGRYFELWDSGVWSAKRDGALAGGAEGRRPEWRNFRCDGRCAR